MFSLGLNLISGKAFSFSKAALAIQRYFTQLDPVSNAHYELATPITFTGDFEWSFDVLGTDLTSDQAFVDSSEFSTGDIGEILLYIDNPDGLRLLVKVLGGTESHVFGGQALILDGKRNTVSLVRVAGVITAFINGAQIGLTFNNTESFIFSEGFIGGGVSRYFNGILAKAKFTDKSGVEDVTTTFALDSGKGVSVENSLEGNNSLTRINVADEEVELYTKTDDGWLGQERAHQLLADWPIKNGAVTQPGIGVFDINYSGAFTNILRDSNMFNLGDTVQWSFNVSNYNSGGGDLFIGQSGVSNFNSGGGYSGVDTAAATDGRFAYASAVMALTLSSLSAKRLIPIATQV